MILTDINNLKFKQLPPPLGGGKNTLYEQERIYTGQ